MTSDLLMTLYVFSAVASLASLIIGIYARNAPKALYFTYLTLAIFIVNSAVLFEITASSFSSALIAVQAQYCGSSFIAPFFLLATLDYCEKKLKEYQLVLLFFIPVLTLLLVLTYPLNGIYYKSLVFTTGSALPHMVVNGSVFYYVYMVYSLLLALASNVVLLYHYRHRSRDIIIKRQTLTVITATVWPMLSVIFNTFNIGGLDLDTTAIALCMTCLLLSYLVIKLGIYRIGPIARAQIVETMSDGFILIDMQGTFIDANSAAKRILPQLAKTSIGMKVAKIEGIAWLSDSADKRKNEFSVQGPNRVNKHYRLSETEISHNKASCRCIMIYDVTEVKHLLDEVSLLAEQDALTGLINRGSLYRRGEPLFNKIAASGGGACMLMLDLDFFKNVNDNYGHVKGDEVLKAIADLLSSSFRVTDLVARYGGEEFCIFLPHFTKNTALNIAEKLRQSTEKLSFSSGGSIFHITLSIGLAVYDPARHALLEDLISAADAALYAAKNAGRNTVYMANAISDDLDIPTSTVR